MTFETLGNIVEFTLAAFLVRRLLGRGARLDRPYEVTAMAMALSANGSLGEPAGAEIETRRRATAASRCT